MSAFNFSPKLNITNLSSTDQTACRNAVGIVKSLMTRQKVYDEMGIPDVEQVAYHTKLIDNIDNIDELVWMCKALASTELTSFMIHTLSAIMPSIIMDAYRSEQALLKASKSNSEASTAPAANIASEEHVTSIKTMIKKLTTWADETCGVAPKSTLITATSPVPYTAQTWATRAKAIRANNLNTAPVIIDDNQQPFELPKTGRKPHKPQKSRTVYVDADIEDPLEEELHEAVNLRADLEGLETSIWQMGWEHMKVCPHRKDWFGKPDADGYPIGWKPDNRTKWLKACHHHNHRHHLNGQNKWVHQIAILDTDPNVKANTYKWVAATNKELADMLSPPRG
jgi:hypothetical protein